MKYIITDENDVIIHISETIGYQENGNVLVGNDTLAIAKPLVKGIFEVESIAEEITENKYCYTEEEGVYTNNNYKEPEPTETQQIQDLQEQVTNLQLALVEIVEGGI